jgi:hypothetical protein
MFFGISLQGLDGRIASTCGFSAFSGHVSSFAMSPEYLLDSLIAESARFGGAISSARAISSSVWGMPSNCLGSGFRGS